MTASLRPRRRTVRLVLSLLAGLLLAGTSVTFTATSARAEDGYRFWGYYQWTKGQWAFSQKGADATVPADGAVEGWRFAVSGAKPRVPRAAGDFAAICGKTPAETGKKRVALVVDPGTPEDALSGETPGPATGTCVVTATASTGAQILAATGPDRIEKGLTCGINGYPAKGCGDQVKNIKVPATDTPVTLQIKSAVGSTAAPASSTSDSNSSSGTPWTGIIIALVVVVLLAGGGFFLNRRRTAAK
ncbi:SCO2322 family protein [Kribbella sp.]|uniref:SCO2322 family protein n=1 Tax=Kribbella sp. TaxID=1871183 RepID=UPI002D6EA61B|nr:SCO2322 family protein [Kribbella sp.]HZX02162.1 SCO2322 family protein [Kribbella sp.]